MSTFFSCHDISLPPLVIESMQRALDNGNLFSNNPRFGYFLPCPLFPTSRPHEFGETLSRPSDQPYQLHINFLQQTATTSLFSTSKPATNSNIERLSDHNTDIGAEWNCSGTDADYSSDLSSSPSPTSKKMRRIVLTSAQAKDVSAFFLTLLRDFLRTD